MLYLELAGGDRPKAIAAYEAMRAEGFEADPLARHRLALTTMFPTAPWSPRDLVGLLGLLVLILITAALPALLVVPIFFVGLLRGHHAGPTAPAGDRWSLKHTWAIGSLLLLTSMLGAYLFAYDTLHVLLFESHVLTSGGVRAPTPSQWAGACSRAART